MHGVRSDVMMVIVAFKVARTVLVLGDSDPLERYGFVISGIIRNG